MVPRISVAHDVLCKSQVQGRRCRHEAREIAHGELEIGARVAEVEHAANHWAIRGGVDAVAVKGELAVHREVGWQRRLGGVHSGHVEAGEHLGGVLSLVDGR